MVEWNLMIERKDGGFRELGDVNLYQGPQDFWG
jgi:hypothetical protein